MPPRRARRLPGASRPTVSCPAGGRRARGRRRGRRRSRSARAVAGADEVVAGAAESAVAAGAGQEVVVARAAERTSSPPRPTSTSSPPSPQITSRRPVPTSRSGPFVPTIVQRRSRPRSSRGRAAVPKDAVGPRRRPGGVPGDDAEGVARARDEARDAQRDVARRRRPAGASPPPCACRARRRARARPRRSSRGRSSDTSASIRARVSEIADAVDRPTTGTPAVRKTTSAPRVVPAELRPTSRAWYSVPGVEPGDRLGHRDRPPPRAGVLDDRGRPVRRRRPELEPPARRASDRVDVAGEDDVDARDLRRGR